MIGAFASAGFDEVRVAGRFDVFEGTTKESTARRYGVMGVNVSAIRSSGHAHLNISESQWEAMVPNSARPSTRSRSLRREQES